MAISPYVTPLTAGSMSARRSGDLFVGMRRELDALQRQMATGLRSDTFAGLGMERRTSLDVRGRLAALDGYQATISGAQMRLSMMTQGLERLTLAAREMRSELSPPRPEPDAAGRSAAQRGAEERLKLALDVLNSQIGGRYFFAGRASDAAPVETLARIMDGEPARGVAGLRQLIAERKAADLGADDLGRLSLSAPGGGTTVTLAESADEAVRRTFGFRLAAASGPAGIGVTVTPATGPTVTLAFAQPPAEGESVRIYVTMPDGTPQTVDLAARAQPDPALAGREFRIDADPAITLANLQAALPAGAAIAGVQSRPVPPGNAPNLSATFAGGSPASVSLTVNAQPPAGERIRVTLALRDGTTTTVALAAQASGDPPVENGFAIGATPEETAQNIAAALETAVRAQARTGLAASAAVVASEDYFSASSDPARRPMRVVAGGTPPSFAAAAGLRAGTAADTMVWYRGDDSARPRGTAPLRIDSVQTVGTGAQANEPALRSMLAQFAVLAAESFAETPTDRDRFLEVADRARTNLAAEPHTMEAMVADFGAALASMGRAKERHQATAAVLNEALAGVEGVSIEEVAASMLALQTRLQASYQTTSILSRLSLVNFL
jgi:flagellar hook-associated protein 3 FlgL